MRSEDRRPHPREPGPAGAGHAGTKLARRGAEALGIAGETPPFPIGDDAPREFLCEEPLAIEVQGDLYAVVIRTPGEEIAHAAGFALAEGIVGRPRDLERIAHCDVEASDVVSLTLTAQRHAQVADLLHCRGGLDRAAPGSGGQWIEDVLRRVTPLEDRTSISRSGIAECIRALCNQQSLRRATRASHACALYDAELHLLALGEDVGRHNAVDKAVGQLFLSNELSRAVVMLVSSRISYELVVKAARAHIPIILALSHPTASAVELGAKLNMTLATIREHAKVSVYRGGHRIKGARLDRRRRHR
jgi:FdhD protein